MAEVQARANLAIQEVTILLLHLLLVIVLILLLLQVKQAAMEEIRVARGAGGSREQEGKEGNCCWNCGRQAGETCSGCGLARWEGVGVVRRKEWQ